MPKRRYINCESLKELVAEFNSRFNGYDFSDPNNLRETSFIRDEIHLLKKYMEKMTSNKPMYGNLRRFGYFLQDELSKFSNISSVLTPDVKAKNSKKGKASTIEIKVIQKNEFNEPKWNCEQLSMLFYILKDEGAIIRDIEKKEYAKVFSILTGYESEPFRKIQSNKNLSDFVETKDNYDGLIQKLNGIIKMLEKLK